MSNDSVGTSCDFCFLTFLIVYKWKSRHLGAEVCCYLFLTFLKKVILWIYILLSIDSISFQDCISPFLFTLFICMQLKPAQI